MQIILAALHASHLQTWRRYRRVPWTAADLPWAWKIQRSYFVSAVPGKVRAGRRCVVVLPSDDADDVLFSSEAGSSEVEVLRKKDRRTVMRCYVGYAGKFVDLLL